MSKEQGWRTAESEEEFITDIVEGALRELENDNEISNILQEAEYKNGLSEAYNPESRLYYNPLDNMRVNSLEDKPVPAGTADYLKKADTVYNGVAAAAKSGIKRVIKSMSGYDGVKLEDYESDNLLEEIIGIMEEIASRMETQPWANQTDAVFFNDPVYVTSVQH